MCVCVCVCLSMCVSVTLCVCVCLPLYVCECGSKKGALKSNVKGNKGEMVKGWWESMLDGKLYVCVWEVGGWTFVAWVR